MSKREDGTDRRETPSSDNLQYWASIPNAPVTEPSKPQTDIQALMEAAPHTEPEESWEGIEALLDLVGEHIDKLDPKERYVIEALFVERISLRAVGRRLSRDKNAVALIRDKALNNLRNALADNPTIKDRYGL